MIRNDVFSISTNALRVALTDCYMYFRIVAEYARRVR